MIESSTPLHLIIPASSLVGHRHSKTMNSSSVGLWCNPPPPGTDEDVAHSPLRNANASPERVIDKIDPYLKSTEYLKYEKRRRSRSRSKHRRHRSRSRGRHRRHRRRYSSSRSRSGSHSRRRHKRRRSRSKSPSRSRRHRRHSRPPKDSKEVKREKLEAEDDGDDTDTANENAFKNDGTFLEMFKKMQEEQEKQKAETEPITTESKSQIPLFGKRRGGKVLKTGMVQKTKNQGIDGSESEDAWTLYMKEVKKYKEACCDDDSKTRLLVK